jgi:hypothetical protein
MINTVSENVQNQIIAFKHLVAEVNKIPGIKIDLSSPTDRQRDALAFLVDEIYHQFKENNWQQVMQDVIQKVRQSNDPPDSLKASKEIVNFIKHLYESRTVHLLANPSIPAEQKEVIQTLFNLYATAVENLLGHSAVGKPVSLAGVPANLLPDWYQQGKYKCN